MPFLNLKSSHKSIINYYNLLQQLDNLQVHQELSVKGAFEDVLKSCCSQFNWTYVAEQSVKFKQNFIRPDGVIIRQDTLKHGFWEAKGNSSNLEVEVSKKFAQNYPKNNILFWQPKRVILYQNKQLAFDDNITIPENLCQVVKLFFEYSQPEIEAWDSAAKEFGSKVQELAKGLLELIAIEKKVNKKFIESFNGLTTLCKQSINPNLSENAVEEMLIQHLLTEPIFRRLFNNPDLVKRNVIAVEIERVIDAVTSKSFNRETFLRGVDYFYKALENAASTITEYQEKQDFLNTVYEKFFQGFAVKKADIYGIVYTPQAIVDFMVSSVEDILKREFNKSLSDKNVHVLDPFVGTGNFILRTMQQLKKTALSDNYAEELHCNEVMLLPYYIALMNIEHEYYQLTGSYKAFENICLIDTFTDQEIQQLELFTPENTVGVKQQRKSPIFVIIGNPPYNGGQTNENDNNKNRNYGEIERRVKETYGKDSTATNVRKIYDPYVKAIRWASDRLGEEGIIALITNNSFITDISFDGMRKNLAQDFNEIYLLDLGGNLRKNANTGQTIHNVFEIKVGVSINFFMKKKEQKSQSAKIYYTSVGQFWTKQEKLAYLENIKQFSYLNWQEITPDFKYNWLTEGLQAEFETFIPLGTKETKKNKTESGVIFQLYSLGISSNRDTWVYNANRENLAENIPKIITTYNQEIFKYQTSNYPSNIDNFVTYDDTLISWSSTLKKHLQRGNIVKYNNEKIRQSLYRPFCQKYLYFDEILIDRRGQFPYIFPTIKSEEENRVICVGGYGRKDFSVIITRYISDLNFYADPQQSFPFYTYNENGENRQENITDWILNEYQKCYLTPPKPPLEGGELEITKWDIFYYIYAILHHPEYRKLYAENLKRELPRIPFAPKFSPFVILGKKLADLHLNYEKQAEYPLEIVENSNSPLSKGGWGGSNSPLSKGGWGGLFRVEKMRLNKDKTELKYNDFLTLKGIPNEVFEYKLGNKSALEWVIDQYQVKTDQRSGIINDCNHLDDEQYILRLIGQIITISLETVKIVKELARNPIS